MGLCLSLEETTEQKEMKEKKRKERVKRHLFLWNNCTAYTANLSHNRYIFYFDEKPDGIKRAIIRVRDFGKNIYDGELPEQYKLWKRIIFKYHNIIAETGGTIHKKDSDFIVNKDAHIHI